ncbi:MAG: tetratricopeptide repeat protein [Nitrospirota bacterium]
MFSKGFSIFLAAALLIALFSVSCAKKETDQAPVGNTEITDFPQEAEMMESALKNDPKNVNILVQLGNLYYDWGQDEVDREGDSARPMDKWSRGINCYEQALDVDPGNVNVRVDMATLMRETGQVDQAISEYRIAIKQDPKHQQARINLILALGQSKQDYRDALAEYDKLIKAVPGQKENMELSQEVASFRQAMKEAKK